ncbi:TetR/AcrR family transcriptional regulator [Paraburkholderia guartelaensis]|uniref:TetR/AcrR family transcriptional regulator n=1 Tax=Paraburkholderia guartelaensis TaxID=2546446 RepID=A0A4R5L5J3_9BURK|nr:TetR/AcrR family transcriptional regulator [Paraburkholderia guartelaensis]TDG02878.1 TetR/AcrR family transcriptional regulator [Paraburkholderia guartelaensis]
MNTSNDAHRVKQVADHSPVADQDQFAMLPPMDRTLTERGRSTVARVLESASAIIAFEGYGALTMRKVAAKVGMSLSNVQHYFKTREDLLAAVIKQTMTQYVTSTSTFLDESLSPRDQLAAVVRFLVEDIKQPHVQSLFGAFWALAQTHDFARILMDEMYVAERKLLAQFIRRINPKLDQKQLMCRAALIGCQIEGLMLLIPQRNRFPSDIRGIEEELMTAVLALANA